MALDKERAECSATAARLQAAQAQLLSAEQQGELSRQECHVLQAS